MPHMAIIRILIMGMFRDLPRLAGPEAGQEVTSLTLSSGFVFLEMVWSRPLVGRRSGGGRAELPVSETPALWD